MGRPRVLLADDHALLLGAFEKLLAGECDIVGQVSDGRALVAAAEKLKPDLIVLDISMPLLNGLEAGRQIKQRLRHVKLVFLTMNEDADLAAEAFRVGASGYLLKRSAASELATAIREVMQGPLVRHAAHHRGPGRHRCMHVDEQNAGRRADAAAAGGAATARRGPFDERGRQRAEPHAADSRFSQVPNDGTAQRQVDRGADPICRQAPHRLNRRASSWSTTTRPCSTVRPRC